MHWNVSVSLLISVVFGNIVEIVAPDNDGPLHLGGDDNSLEDLAPDGDTAGEGAFLIDIARFDGLIGSFEAQPNVLEVPDTGRGLLSEELLAVEEDIFLFLEGPFVLL